MKLTEAINVFESFNNPVRWRKTMDSDHGFMVDQEFHFTVNGKEFKVNIQIVRHDMEYKKIIVDFTREDISGSYSDKISMTNDVGGKDALTVMATVLDIIKKNEYINDARFFTIEMSAVEKSRISLYKRMINRFAKSVTYQSDGSYIMANVRF